jgi:hypothetical protein
MFPALQTTIGSPPEPSTEGDDVVRVLDTLFGDAGIFADATSQQRVVNVDCSGPFDHFGFPVGGVHFIGSRGVQSLEPRALPDVLAIQLPKSDEPRRSTQQQPFETRATRAVPAISSVPTIGDSSSKQPNEPTMSEQARNFLQRIPDLSYMLSSKLSLLTKK